MFAVRTITMCDTHTHTAQSTHVIAIIHHLLLWTIFLPFLYTLQFGWIGSGNILIVAGEPSTAHNTPRHHWLCVMRAGNYIQLLFLFFRNNNFHVHIAGTLTYRPVCRGLRWCRQYHVQSCAVSISLAILRSRGCNRFNRPYVCAHCTSARVPLTSHSTSAVNWLDNSIGSRACAVHTQTTDASKSRVYRASRKQQLIGSRSCDGGGGERCAIACMMAPMTPYICSCHYFCFLMCSLLRLCLAKENKEGVEDTQNWKKNKKRKRKYNKIKTDDSSAGAI